MAVDIITEIEIARPRGEVAAYAADPDHATAYTYEVVDLAPNGSSRSSNSASSSAAQHRPAWQLVVDLGSMPSSHWALSLVSMPK